jgi:septation ring formation regulator EzrA
MIVVVITIIVMVLYKVYITNKENNKRIKELEQRLDEYYKRRENELLNKFRDIEQ